MAHSSRKKRYFVLVKREELKEKLSKNMKLLYGVTLDYWTNKFTSDSYLTTTLHYENNGEVESCVLKTSLFDQSKTAGSW
jgi:hypothetical protein